jgi:hypothetical protein
LQRFHKKIEFSKVFYYRYRIWLMPVLSRIPPTPLFRFVFCVLSFITGTLRMSVDKGPTVPMPDAGVFGRVPLKGTLLFFHWYLQE